MLHDGRELPLDGLVAVGESGERPEPVDIGDQPVLLLRSPAGELAALSNLCAHRGTLLVERPANAKRIQCPYHAWTYNDGGRLLSVPFAPKGAIDKAAHCLPVYRVESWHGLIFVSLDPDVEPLTERFAAVEPHVAARGIDQLHHRSDQQEAQVWDCNWKLAILNAMESYHLFQVHPKTLEPYTPTKDAYYITGSARATATGGRSKGQDDYLLISLPPNFVGAAAYSLLDFLPEDKAICERGQRGATGDFVPGRLVPMERVVADFGHYLNWRLNHIEPPAVHTEMSP